MAGKGQGEGRERAWAIKKRGTEAKVGPEWGARKLKRKRRGRRAKPKKENVKSGSGRKGVRREGEELSVRRPTASGGLEGRKERLPAKGFDWGEARGRGGREAG